MQILLTNDDGIYAPGLTALEKELDKLGDVAVVSPATEQSGVGHSITFLRPLVCKEVYEGERFRGWAVEGSPADCVKLGVFEFCQKRPDLVVSGINGGLNAGINVLYSGTVAAAIEGAFFGITSIAISLEFEEHARYEDAARIARGVIEQILAKQGNAACLYNVNIPTAALDGDREICVVPMGIARYGEHFLKRKDPRGRTYYWATDDPPPSHPEHPTDLSEITRGKITVTPLDFDLTRHDRVAKMREWGMTLKQE